jgi:hypothetical protein
VVATVPTLLPCGLDSVANRIRRCVSYSVGSKVEMYADSLSCLYFRGFTLQDYTRVTHTRAMPMDIWRSDATV